MSDAAWIICEIIGGIAIIGTQVFFMFRAGRQRAREWREEATRHLEEARTQRYQQYGKNIMKGIYD